MKTKMERFLEDDPNPVISVANDGTVLYSNRAGKPLLHEWGAEVGEKLPFYIRDFVQRVISRNSSEKMEVKMGERVYFVAFHPSLKDECVNIYGVDISDKKEIERKLRESEGDLAEVQKMAHIGNWKWNIVINELHWSDEVYRIFGLKPQEFSLTFDAYFNYVHPDDRDYLNNAIKKAFEGEPYSIDNRIITANGEERIVHTDAEFTFNENNIPVYARGIVQDITKRKRTEEALQESKARVESIFRSSPVGIGVVVDRMIKEANERLCEMTGYSREELLGKSALMLYPTAEEYERVGSVKYGMMGGHNTGYVETHWQRKDGSIVDILLSSSPIVLENLSGEITFTALDITERKHAEEALKKAYETLEKRVKERTAELEKAYNSLKESEQGLAEAQKMAHIGNWEWDIANDKAYWSDELYRIFGLSPQEFAPPYNEYLSSVHPDDRDYADNAHKKALNGKPFSIDHRIILANGEERIVHIQSETIFNDENIPIRLKGIIQDITEHKKAEEKIQTLANAVESSSDAIITVSLDGIITSWNKAAEQVYDYSAQEVIGKSVSILAPSHLREETKKLTEIVIQGEKVHQYETLRLRKDGTIINVSITLSPVFDITGKLVAISGIVRDVTERIKAEEALENLEIARKKEIHHRIKNNLQVISSLLDLQAEKFGNREFIMNSEVLEAFRESQDRVISMALIHEELHKSEGLDTLNISPYIEELAENLFQTYYLGNANISLNMDLEENIFLDMDTAVPLGIIINELISNSLKHAFTEDEEGEIRIKFHREENGEHKKEGCKSTSFILTVSDNGIGLPENLDIEDIDSLGLQLVTSLVDQLDGELELKRNNGTEFTIRFTVTEINEQTSAPAPQ